MYASHRRSISPLLMQPISSRPSASESTTTPRLDVGSFSRLTRTLIKLRDNGELSDQEFETVVGIVTAAFVEQELTSRFDRVMTDSFDRVFAGYRF